MSKLESIKVYLFGNLPLLGIFLLGILLLFGGIVDYKETKGFFDGASALTGTVIEVKNTITYSKGEKYIWDNPVIEFETPNGETIRYEAEKTKTYQTGDNVTIYYNDKYKPSVKFPSWDGKEELWVESFILIGVGTIFSLAGISLLIGILKTCKGIAIRKGILDRESILNNKFGVIIKPHMHYPIVIFLIIFIITIISGLGTIIYLLLQDIKVGGDTFVPVVSGLFMLLAMGAVVLKNYMYRIKVYEDKLILKTFLRKKIILYSDIDDIDEDKYNVYSSTQHKLYISTNKGNEIIDFYSEMFDRSDIEELICLVKSKIDIN